MTEREVALAAIAVSLGAVIAVSVPLLLIIAVVALALIRRYPALVIVALGLSATWMAARSVDGLQAPPTGTRITGNAVLRSDPERRPGGLVVEVGVGNHRYRSFVEGAHAAALAEASVGNEVAVAGSVSPLVGPWAWRASRHLAAQLRITRVGSVQPGQWWWQSARWVHDALADGVRSLGEDEQALFLGVVLGDDRGQSEVERYRFRTSGLAHLLAVSGQNVAFLLVAASPVLRRLRLRPRWALGIGLVVWFAVVTRLEPSVLRAAAMAIVAATAAGIGRYVTGLRVVSTAVVVLVLIDPMLVWSTGFRLSVAASVAIITLARPIARGVRRLTRVPRPVADALGVTLAAQVGTAPLLVALAGSTPVLGPVCNLVAVPVAGVLMAYGVVAGPAGGVLGAPVASVLAWPSGAMCRWIAGVAEAGANPSLPRVGTTGTFAMVGAILVLAAVGRHDTVSSNGRAQVPGALRRRSRLRRAAAVCCMTLALGDMVFGRPVVTPATGAPADSPLRMWSSRTSAVLVINAGATERAALDLVGRSRRPRIDLIIVLGGGMASSSVVFAVRSAVEVVHVVARDPSTIRDAIPLSAGEIDVGDLELEVTSTARHRWAVGSRERRAHR